MMKFLMFTGVILMLMIPMEVNAGADISKFVGTWRGQTRDIAGRPAINEMVLMRNGQFSGLTKSSSGFVILIQGKYQVNSDFIRFTIEKWEPRSYLGKSINTPRGETTYYRFINANQMRVGSTKCSFGRMRHPHDPRALGKQASSVLIVVSGPSECQPLLDTQRRVFRTFAAQ